MGSLLSRPTPFNWPICCDQQLQMQFNTSYNKLPMKFNDFTIFTVQLCGDYECKWSDMVALKTFMSGKYRLDDRGSLQNIDFVKRMRCLTYRY